MADAHQSAPAPQDNAFGSLLDHSGSYTNGVLDRKAILGFNQDQNRHLLVGRPAHAPRFGDLCVQRSGAQARGDVAVRQPAISKVAVWCSAG